MKDEKNVRHRRTAGFRKRLAAIVLAAVFMSVFMPFCSVPVFADVDLTQPCSLTVTVPESMSAEDVQEAQLVVDLYRVAYATPDTEGYDTYHWENVGIIADQLDLPEGTDRKGWAEKAVETAKLVLGSGQYQWDPAAVEDSLVNSFVPMAADTTGIAGAKAEGMPVNAPIEGLTPGIYLIVPRGNNIKEYASVNQKAFSESGSSDDNPAMDATSAAAEEDPDVVSEIVTLARSGRNTYQFSPQLIALPTKEALDTGEIKTSNPSDWIYDASIVLKPDQMAAGGDLEIIKDLDTYELRKKNNNEGVSRDVIDNATFVFEVSAYTSEDIYNDCLSRGEEAPRIYHDFKSITFNDAYDKRILIEDIPVGSYVIVTEVYSGRSYEATVDTTQTTTIEPDKAATVKFGNTYDGRHGGGGSVTNNFVYGESGWVRESVEQISDNSTESEHISYPSDNAGNYK